MIQPEPASNTPTYAERVIGRDIEMSVAYGNGQVDIAAAVAQALADQRAKYETGIREVEDLANRIVPCNDFWRGDLDGLNMAIEIMHRALR